jgi:hypothetical protein
MVPEVKDDGLAAKGGRPRHVVGDALPRPVSQGLVGGSEIHEIAGVDDQRRHIVGVQHVAEAFDLCFCVAAAAPATGVSPEDLQTLALEAARSPTCLDETIPDRNVESESHQLSRQPLCLSRATISSQLPISAASR